MKFLLRFCKNYIAEKHFLITDISEGLFVFVIMQSFFGALDFFHSFHYGYLICWPVILLSFTEHNQQTTILTLKLIKNWDLLEATIECWSWLGRYCPSNCSFSAAFYWQVNWINLNGEMGGIWLWAGLRLDTTLSLALFAFSSPRDYLSIFLFPCPAYEVSLRQC